MTSLPDAPARNSYDQTTRTETAATLGRLPADRRAGAPGARDGYAWSTPVSFAFFVGLIVLAFILAELLALVIVLQPG